MKVICAWCLRFLYGQKNCRNLSHGICPPCAYRMVGFLPEVPVNLWAAWQDLGGEG